MFSIYLEKQLLELIISEDWIMHSRQVCECWGLVEGNTSDRLEGHSVVWCELVVSEKGWYYCGEIRCLVIILFENYFIFELAFQILACLLN